MNTPNHKTHQPLNILAFDTSGEEASLALWTAGNMRHVSLPIGVGAHSQAACLLPMMQDLLKEEGLGFPDLHVIATPTGPGSFTGIRVGLATAQGLALSLKVQNFAPTTFRLFAFGAWKERQSAPSSLPSDFPCLVTLTTKRDSFYTQAFEKVCVPVGTAHIQTEDEIQSFLALHPTVCRISHLSVPSTEHLIHFYFYQLAAGGVSSEEGIFRPYYLHNPEFVKQRQCSPSSL